MGCWGITAFESDTGLDAIGLIRNHLPEQGDVKLQQMIDWLRADSWNAPPEVSEGVSHTSPMAVAELIVKFQEKDFSALDGIRGDKKFSSLSSFTASKESLQWVREYLSETLFTAVNVQRAGEVGSFVGRLVSGTGLEALAGAYGKTDWKDG